MKQWSQQKRQDLDYFTWTSSEEQSLPTVSSGEKTDELAGREWITMYCKSLWRAMQIMFKKKCKCFILLQTLPCFLIVFTYKILFFMAWHRKRCLLYWQLKARFDQLISRLKISWIKFLKMGLSLSKHIVLMINFYLFKNLTKDQISLFMADLNPSLFCPAKLQAYLWKLFWELYFPTLGNICQIRKFQLLLLNLLGNSWIPW